LELDREINFYTRKENDDIVVDLEGFSAYADRDLEVTDMSG
jgi:hypothetical protein